MAHSRMPPLAPLATDAGTAPPIAKQADTAFYISNASTPTRTRSTSSSNFSQNLSLLSTFPSSTAPPQACYAPAIAVPIGHDEHVTSSSSFLDGRPQHHCCHLPPQPHSLLASPSPCLRSRARVRRRGNNKKHGHDSADANNQVEDADDDDDNHTEVETLNSQTLAWDQTCLRIAYLVSTMVAPVGPRARGDADEAGAQPSSSMMPAPSTALARPEQGPAPSNLPEPSLYCWPGMSLPKKHLKIAQIHAWRMETSTADSTAYCGCCTALDTTADGSAAPPSASDHDESHGARVLLPRVCGDCGHLFQPHRPVADAGADAVYDLPRSGSSSSSRRSHDYTAASLRKAFRSMCGLMTKKSKNKIGLGIGSGELRCAGNLSSARALWERWYAAADTRDPASDFYTHTTMYHASVSNNAGAAATTATATAAGTSSGQDKTQKPQAAHDIIDSNEDVDGHSALKTSASSISSTSTSSRADPQSRERRRQREAITRLHRAQELLQQQAVRGRAEVAPTC